MPTECSRDLFGYEVVEGRQVVAAFDGGAVTSDAGGAAARRDRSGDRAGRAVRRLLQRWPRARRRSSTPSRRWWPAGVRHRARLRGPHRPRSAAPRSGAGGARRQARGQAPGLRAAGRQEHAEPAGARAVASRAATTRSATTRRRSSACSSTSSSRRTRRRPKQIILDLDATDDPLHGHQEGRFFHGYYDCYCYLPLYVFCGRHLLAAKLRRSNIDAVGRRQGRGGAHRRPDPGALAAGADPAARRIRALPARS